jgi:uncharacterized OB-fold protein
VTGDDGVPATDHPLATPETAPFWAALRKGRLLLKLCLDCRQSHFYPRATCPFCSSRKLEWQEVAGSGVIYSYSVMRRAEVPYCLAMVEVAHDVRMMTNVVNSNLDLVRIGSPVHLDVTMSGDGHPLPTFSLSAKEGHVAAT